MKSCQIKLKSIGVRFKGIDLRMKIQMIEWLRVRLILVVSERVMRWILVSSEWVRSI